METKELEAVNVEDQEIPPRRTRRRVLVALAGFAAAILLGLGLGADDGETPRPTTTPPPTATTFTPMVTVPGSVVDGSGSVDG